MLLVLQGLADKQAKLQRNSLVRIESGKDLKDVFSPRPIYRNTSAVKTKLIGEVPYDDAKHIEYQKIAELTQDTGDHVAVLKNTLEKEGILTRSRSLIANKSLPLLKEEKTMKYVKSVVHDFLENDKLDAPSKKYLAGAPPLPIVQAHHLQAVGSRSKETVSRLNTKRPLSFGKTSEIGGRMSDRTEPKPNQPTGNKRPNLDISVLTDSRGGNSGRSTKRTLN